MINNYGVGIMLDILIYVCIILFGVFLVRKKLFPEKLLKKVSLLQSLSLYLLLGAMGYKIGSDDKLISNLHILGVKALIISVFAIVFSIFFVKVHCIRTY